MVQSPVSSSNMVHRPPKKPPDEVKTLVREERYTHLFKQGNLSLQHIGWPPLDAAFGAAPAIDQGFGP
jgi:hypothetical protein